MNASEFSLDCNLVDIKMLDQYRTHNLDSLLRAQVKHHLENCHHCWALWNRLRWDYARDTLGYLELKAYLGSNFQTDFDSSWALAHEWNDRNPSSKAQIEAFYQQTPFYLYNLLIWQESGQRPPYVSRALSALQFHQSKVICDFGCGIGNDGLILLEKGYDVIFCDINDVSIEFLKWRLDRRKLVARVVRPEELSTISFDTLWSTDVIEHLPFPQETLGPLLDSASVFIYDTEDVTSASGRHPFHIQHSEEDFIRFLHQMNFVWDRDFQGINVWHRT